MDEITFIKAHGAGNDFIIIDDRQVRFPVEEDALISHLCERRFGIGADGLILLQNSSSADYRMRYFNADGREVALCGNGLRCFVLFASTLDDLRTELLIETTSELITCLREGNRVTSQFAPPKIVKGPFPLSLFFDSREIFLVHAGVPHVIMFTDQLDDEEVEILGKEIRYHPTFLPEGVNVNFVEWKGGKNIRIRTYERGVEGETLACGTGALAAARVVSHLGKLDKVSVFPRSTDEIEIDTTNWKLTGPAKLVYAGTIRVPERRKISSSRICQV